MPKLGDLVALKLQQSAQPRSLQLSPIDRELMEWIPPEWRDEPALPAGFHLLADEPVADPCQGDAADQWLAANG